MIETTLTLTIALPVMLDCSDTDGIGFHFDRDQAVQAVFHALNDHGADAAIWALKTTPDHTAAPEDIIQECFDRR